MAWYPNQYGQGTPGYSGYVGPISYGYSGAMQQPQTNVPQGQSGGMPAGGIIWVDGEVGAKAYQMPAGWPAGTPIALWDTNDRVIYWKSINQMGMPNPLLKIPYHIEDLPQYLPGQSGTTPSNNQDMSGHDQQLKQEIDSLRSDVQNLRELLQQKNSSGNQNSNQIMQQSSNGGNGNRGGRNG